MVRQFQRLKDESNDYRKSFAKIDNEFIQLKRNIDKKADEHELQDIKTSLHVFAEKADLKKIEK